MNDFKRRTPSYEKHFLTHTDFTGGGHRNSYPKSTFDWNLLFLKNSWGTKLKGRQIKKQDDPATKHEVTNSPGRHLTGVEKRTHMVQGHSTLGSIPEHKAVGRISSRRTMDNNTPTLFNSGRSPLKTLRSNSSASFYTDISSISSTTLSRIPLNYANKDLSSITPSASRCCTWPFQREGRGITAFCPLQGGKTFSEKQLFSAPYIRDQRETQDLIHQSLGKLELTTTGCAVKARLRSPLYKPEQSQTQPTIFRSNLVHRQKPKQFNPRYHGDITRPDMVHSFTYKQPLTRAMSSSKWKMAESTGKKWTTYRSLK